MNDVTRHLRTVSRDITAGSKASDQTVVTAGSFVISFPSLPGGAMAFSELQGISSKVNVTEYIQSDAKNGDVQHTKQFGKTEPPTITLKRGLDEPGNKYLLAWHLLARHGEASARSTGTLDVFDARGQKVISYVVQEAWCQELTISAVKAGDSAVTTIEVKITCAEIDAG